MDIRVGDHPPLVEFDERGIPAELKLCQGKLLTQWVVTRLRWIPATKKGGEKLDKPPLMVDGRNASTTDPATWCTYGTALAAVRSGHFDAPGFVFTPDDPYVGVDLDGCRDPVTGEIDRRAQSIVSALASWTEVSVSGTGLHLVVKALLPPGRRAKDDRGKKHTGVALYDYGRYFVLTGQRVAGTPAENFECQKEVDAIHAELFPSKPKKEPTSHMHVNSGGALQDDDELIKAARSAKNGDKFTRLFDTGDIDDYASQSEADLALCTHLAYWTKDDGTRIDRLFRCSTLMRDKWDEPRPGGTYGSVTIEKAITQRNYYQANGGGHAGRTHEEEPDKPATNALPPYSEECMALTFTERHLEDVRFVGDTKDWLVWDDKTQLWRFDDRRRVFSFAREIVREFAPTAGRPDKVSKIARASARAGVVSSASDDQRTSILRSDLDRHPMLAATPAGVLDLETGRLRHNDRGLFITKSLAVTPATPETPHPVWTAFLNSTFTRTDQDGALVRDDKGNLVPDAEVIAFLQRYYGSCLTGVVDDQKFLFHYGSGRNGKGILVYTIHDILGEYAVRLPSEIFMERRMEPHRTELADLWGARLAVVSEIPTSAHWNQSRLMDLTGGDPVRANKMRQDPSQVPASHKLGFLGNTKPRFRAINTAVIERLLLIRHPRSFFSSADDAKKTEGADVRDGTLRQRLCAEHPAILRWLIDGCLQWRKSGLKPPANVIAAAREYLGDENLIGAWMEECCVKAEIPSAEDSTSFMRISYNEWRRDRNEPPVSDRNFKRDLETQGRRIHHTDFGNCVVGVKLTDAARDQATKVQALDKAARTAGRSGNANLW